MSESQRGKYDVEIDGDGNVQRVKHRGQEVRLGTPKQGFCDFLSWATCQPTELSGVYSTNLRARYFASTKKLFGYCKKHGVTLATGFPVVDSNVQLADGVRFTIDAVEFIGLRECQAPPASWGLDRFVDGLTKTEVPRIVVTDSLLLELNGQIADETSDVCRLSNWPIAHSFVFVDVSDFSQYKPGQQVLIVKSLLQIINDDSLWKKAGSEVGIINLNHAHEAMLCIGDGYIFVFKSPVVATYFSARLANLIEFMVAKREVPIEFHFRMGVHTGPAYYFWDPGRNDWNYSGAGINGGSRVLSAIGKDMDDVLFISGGRSPGNHR